MASQVDIVNLALAKISTDRAITAMGNASKEARVANRLWDQILDEVLEARNWSFALKTQALAVDAQAAMPGWTYRYAKPNDCLTLKAVTDENGLRIAGGRLACFTDGDWLQAYRNHGVYDYECTYGDSGESIHTDIEAAYAVYVMRVTDTGRYSAHFTNALATRLAAEMAPTIVGEQGLRVKQAMLDPRGGEYAIALSLASEHSSNQSRHRLEAVTPSLAARG